jgi:DNA-binding transcriptional MerR regulator
MSWAPQECTLPTAERPLRAAEFDELFATRLRSLARPDPSLLRLVLDDEDGGAATARDLVAREQACCALFQFELTSTPEGLRVDVRVPPGRTEVLDGLGARAAAAGAKRLASDATMTDGLRSGEVAAAAGVNPQTLRYYERRGLLAEPRRSAGGHRLYPAEAVTVLRVVKTAQRLGFTLDEVADLMGAARHRHGSAPDRGLQRRAEAKLAEIDAKIGDLASIRTTLVAAIDAGCDDLTTCANTPNCPLPFAELAEPGREPTGVHMDAGR